MSVTPFTAIRGMTSSSTIATSAETPAYRLCYRGPAAATAEFDGTDDLTLALDGVHVVTPSTSTIGASGVIDVSSGAAWDTTAELYTHLMRFQDTHGFYIVPIGVISSSTYADSTIALLDTAGAPTTSETAIPAEGLNMTWVNTAPVSLWGCIGPEMEPAAFGDSEVRRSSGTLLRNLKAGKVVTAATSLPVLPVRPQTSGSLHGPRQARLDKVSYLAAINSSTATLSIYSANETSETLIYQQTSIADNAESSITFPANTMVSLPGERIVVKLTADHFDATAYLVCHGAWGDVGAFNS